MRKGRARPSSQSFLSFYGRLFLSHVYFANADSYAFDQSVELPWTRDRLGKGKGNLTFGQVGTKIPRNGDSSRPFDYRTWKPLQRLNENLFTFITRINIKTSHLVITSFFFDNLVIKNRCIISLRINFLMYSRGPFLPLNERWNCLTC